MELTRSSGVLAHPTSFPSDFGIGDLGSFSYFFIDYLYKAKQKYWQVLPLGHTSFGDSPYQSFSTFAGNPLLISPELLFEEGYLDDVDIVNVPESDPMQIHYGEVITYKYQLFRKAFQNFGKRASMKQRMSYESFVRENEDWLIDYSLFVSIKNYFIEKRKNTIDSEEYKEYERLNKKRLKRNEINDYFYGAVWNSWPEDISNRVSIDKYSEMLAEEIKFYNFLQFEFFRQWSKLKEYANKKNIQIIGDIPIFVAMDSADAWSNPNLFYLDEKGYPTEVAGVPPDYFSKTGQLWGNPLYNWEVHRKSNYEWWIKRISSTLKLADVLRIDHFRGFESYWSVPFGEETAIEGKWNKGPGADLFIALKDSLGSLPIIAEDLGIITEEVTKLRESLSLPGMKVLQFAFDGMDYNAHLPHNYKKSDMLLYTGTHDNDTTSSWYDQLPETSRDFIRRYMNISGEDPAWEMIRLAYSSIAEIVIVPIQDLMGLGKEYRMNTPGTPSGNWTFRFAKEMLLDVYADRLVYLCKLFERNLDLIKVEKEKKPDTNPCAARV